MADMRDISCLIHDQQQRIQQLESELADIHAAHRVVMEEKCHGDERHCTCVPVLRMEIERLRAIEARGVASAQERVGLRQEVFDLTREVERLRAEAADLLDCSLPRQKLEHDLRVAKEGIERLRADNARLRGEYDAAIERLEAGGGLTPENFFHGRTRGDTCDNC